MMEDLLMGVTRTISQFVLEYWVLYVLFVLGYLTITFRHRIDYMFLKHDRVWRKWYKSAYRCPACVIRLRPADYPPNYRCLKCGNTYSFGDPAAKAWIDHKPLLTKGEFFRYVMLLAYLALGAVWVFSSGVLG